MGTVSWLEITGRCFRHTQSTGRNRSPRKRSQLKPSPSWLFSCREDKSPPSKLWRRRGSKKVRGKDERDIVFPNVSLQNVTGFISMTNGPDSYFNSAPMFMNRSTNAGKPDEKTKHIKE